MRPTTPAGRAIYEEFEQGPTGGPALIAYLCPAGKPTIGYGHTEGVRLGDTLPSKAAAEMLLDQDLIKYGAEVERALGDAPTSQNEFEALRALDYNVGFALFSTSTALRLHKNGDKLGAATALEWFNKATVAGKLVTMPGLVRRRAMEKALYLTPDPNPDIPRVQPMPQEVAAPRSVTASPTLKAATTVAIPAAAVVIDNAQPAIDAIQNAATTVTQATTAWGATKDALAPLANGHVLTVLLLSVSLVAIGYIAFRVFRRIRKGEVSA